jgi:tetratricopeptide (TPR) repeat protein
VRRKKHLLVILFLIIFALPVYALINPADISSYEDADKAIALINQKITSSPARADLYVSRGDLYFLIHDFDRAEEDYTRAISLDKDLDAAYYGRGMTLGRQGFIKEGIADLSIFIDRNPDSSLAYTKRGVRYIWLGDRDNAFKDLSKAIQLDPNNAEAHDDLGVVLAQKGEYDKAFKHFHTTVRLDPTYQKAYHNLAMAYFITDDDSRALLAVNNSLKLAPEYRDSLLLKSKIFEAMGRVEEAMHIKEEAEFLPESGDWSEHAPVE